MSERLNKRVLFVGLVWPEPTSTAAGQNILSYINLFRDEGYEVTFACAADKSDQSAPLASLGINEQAIRLNDSSFDHFVRALSPDVTVFDRFISEEQFGWRVSCAAPGCMKILDCEDLHFLRDARHHAYKHAKQNGIDLNETTVTTPFLFSDICKRELASIMRCDLSILLSDVEYNLLVDVFGVPKTILHCCPFLLDDTFQEASPSFDERVDFVSIGSFRHAPNWNAVLTLKQLIWPAIRKALPHARCHVYGSYLSPKAKQLENAKEGFLVHGFVADAKQAIRHAKVLLAPLNFGAGIKGKLVDAMQCHTPSVTTAIGTEGLLPVSLDESNWPGAVCNIGLSSDEFIAASICLYSDKKRWQSASLKSGSLFKAVFNFDRQSAALLNTIAAINTSPNALTAHRQKHFMGQVIQHHTLSSTKYMSQWIEAKTRLQEATKQIEN